MKNKIRKALLMTEGEYEGLVFNYWFNWCIKYGTTDVEVQMLCANSALFSWWFQLYGSLEQEFYQKMPFESDNSKRGRYLLHVQCVNKIYQYHSKALITNAKKLQVHAN